MQNNWKSQGRQIVSIGFFKEPRYHPTLICLFVCLFVYLFIYLFIYLFMLLV